MTDETRQTPAATVSHASLIERMKKCAFYDFDAVEMVECKWAMWEEILNAIEQLTAYHRPEGS